MGFLPQYYIIKDAWLSDYGLSRKPFVKTLSTKSEIVDVGGHTYDTIYNVERDISIDLCLAGTGKFLFASILDVSPSDLTVFKLYISEDNNENKLIVDGLDHAVEKSATNVHKLFENGKNYCLITYTNNKAEFNIATVRIAIPLHMTSAYNTVTYFMIYSEPIDPITIGTGETVQIKIEV